MQIWAWLVVVVCLLRPLPLMAEEPVIPDPQWQVARAQFTSGIENREPVDRVVVATPLIHEIYFFTDLRNLGGRTITHRWKYEGKVVSLVPFNVGGPRWRVYSKKEIEPDQVGEWSVTVVDESGWPLYTELFRYEDGAPLLQPADNPVSRQEPAVGELSTDGAAVGGTPPETGTLSPRTEPAAGSVVVDQSSAP